MRDMARDYVALARVDEQIEQSLQTYDQQFTPQIPPERRAAFQKMMAAAVGWDALKEPIIELIAETYTREELAASIAFLQSPAGASANSKGPEFARRVSQLMANNFTRVMEQLKAQGGAPGK